MQIKSVAALIEVFDGGYKEVSRLCEVSDHASLMWKLRGRLPRHTYPVLSHELKQRGHTAPFSLWRMREPGSAPQRRRSNGKGRHK